MDSSFPISAGAYIHYLIIKLRHYNTKNPLTHTPRLAAIGFLILLLAGCTGAAVRAPISELEGPELRVTFLDVGGDSVLIETPNGKRVLVDAGNEGSSSGQWLSALNADSIDVAIATHPDKDHIGGFIQLKGRIKEMLSTGISCSTRICKEFDASYNHTTATYGYSINIDPAVEMTVINPGRVFEKDNDNSIVLKVRYGETGFLFTGDCEKACEEELMRQDIDVDVLKVSHHGSRSSTSQAFLDAASPAISVIGVGQNSYGHPHKEVLERLEGMEWYRTDEGTVRLLSDGRRVSVERLKRT